MSREEGFSAVELLITLFIGAVFIFAGYQLSTQVSKDGADTTKTAAISDIVYDRLRKIRFDNISSACSIAAPPANPNNETLTVDGFKGNVTIQTTYECPFDQVGVFKVTVAATYNDGISQKVLSHAYYTN